MDIKQIGYYLYMQSEEDKRRKDKELLESRKVNLKTEPFLQTEQTTTITEKGKKY